MYFTMRQFFKTAVAFVLLSSAAQAQKPAARVFKLPALEPVEAHYKTLQTKSPVAQPGSAADTLKFPLEEYSDLALMYVLSKPYYLNPAQVESLVRSATPPANSSEQTRAELDYLLELQSKRTPEQEKRVLFLGDIGYWPHIDLSPKHAGYAKNLTDLFFEGRTVLGERYSAQNFPAVARLLKNAMQDMRVLEFSLKYAQRRPRPYHLESQLQPLQRMKSPAFASGHTLWAFLQAYLWAELFPEKRVEFLNLAEEIRRSREIMGIHYPSDNESARQIAHRMLRYYQASKHFQADFAAALGGL
jgi:acid phosphatase (class A)